MKDKLETVHTKVTPDLMSSTPKKAQICWAFINQVMDHQEKTTVPSLNCETNKIKQNPLMNIRVNSSSASALFKRSNQF
jgi:hypothetical protein